MIDRKPLTPRPQRSIKSEFAYSPFPKANERPSIVGWASPGKGVQGESVTGGNYRRAVVRRDLGTR